MKKGNIVIVILFVTIAVSALVFGIYFYNRYQSSQKTNSDTQEKLNQVEKEKSRLEEEKTALANQYCAAGQIYENILQNYKVCYPNGWYNETLDETKSNVVFTTIPSSTEHRISIAVTSSDMEQALARLANDVHVDTTDRNYSVDGQKAFEVTGKVLPDKKKAITVFSKSGKTYEILLVNNADATYTDYLDLYKQIVKSFKFID